MSFFINNINNSSSSYVYDEEPYPNQLQTLTTKEGASLEYYCNVQGQKHGEARAYMKNGDIIDFFFIQGKPQGTVIETWIDGTKLSYELQGGYRHGKASILWPNQMRMDYQYFFGIKQGEATETYPDGTQFVFEFRDNIREGIVIKQTFQERICVGEYIHGLFGPTERYIISDESTSEEYSCPPIKIETGSMSETSFCEEVSSKYIYPPVDDSLLDLFKSHDAHNDMIHELKNWLDEK